MTAIEEMFAPQKEDVVITRDLDCPADDYLRAGFKVEDDRIVEVKSWNAGFPMEHTLTRVSL